MIHKRGFAPFKSGVEVIECYECSTINKDSAIFCKECGTSIEDDGELKGADSYEEIIEITELPLNNRTIKSIIRERVKIDLGEIHSCDEPTRKVMNVFDRCTIEFTNGTKIMLESSLTFPSNWNTSVTNINCLLM